MQYLANNHTDFPHSLRLIDQPAKGIYLQGNIPKRPLVAVVGARRCDDYGLQMAARFGQGLAKAGVSVVSGGAAGVDTAALAGCLSASGQPVCVLGTGLDMAYPASNRALFQRIGEQGALLSEYAPGTPGLPSNFPKRNRLIAALSTGVVVVRAALGSGSLITARWALRQKRPLMAVPGPVGDPLSAGVHYLLKQGAHLVEGTDDILRILSLTTPQTDLDFYKAPEPKQTSVAKEETAPSMSPDEHTVLCCLGTQLCPIDVVVEKSGLSTSQVSALLLQMELKGWVRQHPGMHYKRVV